MLSGGGSWEIDRLTERELAVSDMKALCPPVQEHLCLSICSGLLFDLKRVFYMFSTHTGFRHFFTLKVFIVFWGIFSLNFFICSKHIFSPSLN